MAVYLVACELKLGAHDYGDLRRTIDAYDSSEIMSGVYLIDAPADAHTLRRHLEALVSTGDRIWVSRVTEEHSGYVMAPAAEWLDQRKPL